ncbi:hypothetical protein [Nocardioides plantarum]|uniref:Uncharacterized protein n=1 Tax=Nocardioides plantarum TaxID=29299 RepID=A0ABV5KBR7_9ACTN|nr:hypothetical protein [Nocardioides plantarum]
MADKSGEDGLQGLFAVVGIWLGVIPLVRVAFGGEVGRLASWLPGVEGDTGRWLVPAVIVVGCVAVIAALERAKQRG